MRYKPGSIVQLASIDSTKTLDVGDAEMMRLPLIGELFGCVLYSKPFDIFYVISLIKSLAFSIITTHQSDISYLNPINWRLRWDRLFHFISLPERRVKPLFSVAVQADQVKFSYPQAPFLLAASLTSKHGNSKRTGIFFSFFKILFWDVDSHL